MLLAELLLELEGLPTWVIPAIIVAGVAMFAVSLVGIVHFIRWLRGPELPPR